MLTLPLTAYTTLRDNAFTRHKLRFVRLLISRTREPMRVWRGGYEAAPERKGREPRENPQTSGIVLHDFRMRKIREQPRRASKPVRLGNSAGGKKIPCYAILNFCKITDILLLKKNELTFQDILRNFSFVNSPNNSAAGSRVHPSDYQRDFNLSAGHLSMTTRRDRSISITFTYIPSPRRWDSWGGAYAAANFKGAKEGEGGGLIPALTSAGIKEMSVSRVQSCPVKCTRRCGAGKRMSNNQRPVKFASLFGFGLNFTVLYILEPVGFLRWLLHRCEATPFLAGLRVTEQRNCRVFVFGAELHRAWLFNFGILSSDEVEAKYMDQHRSERAGESGDPREKPPTSGIVRHDTQVHKPPPGIEPCSHWWETKNGDTNPTAAPFNTKGLESRRGRSEAGTEQRRNERVGETGDPRENSPTSGIVRPDFHLREITSRWAWQKNGLRRVCRSVCARNTPTAVVKAVHDKQRGTLVPGDAGAKWGAANAGDRQDLEQHVRVTHERSPGEADLVQIVLHGEIFHGWTGERQSRPEPIRVQAN
ncbi:hypothetical protein PR048_030537 [Dryococelus australis]|uniref:Uncharacterized protein n=1 Tax=Dryococelus australis TaxID=614101 RepID=A0ABQ9GBU3_9NEOP|nr:hypothetical protein PR048_030537 [Dryococelus australis]